MGTRTSVCYNRIDTGITSQSKSVRLLSNQFNSNHLMLLVPSQGYIRASQRPSQTTTQKQSPLLSPHSFPWVWNLPADSC